MYVHKGLAISVIDDDPQMAESMVKFLKQKFTDAEITVYHTGKAALQGIINEPDLIILDYHLDAVDMDNFNGLQVLIKIKERFQHTPVIFLSSQEQAEIAANTMKFGAYDYIVHNEYTFHRLEIIIANILGHAELKKNLGTQRFFNTLLLIAIAILVLGYIIYRMR